MHILFFLSHPAHYYFFKNVIQILESRGHSTTIVIKKKDILEELLINEGKQYTNIQPQPRERKNNKFSIILSSLLDLAERDFQLFRLVRKQKPDLMIGSETSIAHVGKLLCIPSIVTTEDDFAVQKEFCYPTFPFATKLVAPDICDLGPWEKKKVGYNGYQKLSYLHPDYFDPDAGVVKNFNADGSPYFLLRFVKLTAHHDLGAKGISQEIAKRIINLLEPHGKVCISSESTLDAELEKYRLQLNPNNIHHVLAHAEMLIGDSQSMAVEASILGVPSIRFSHFIGNISVLEELEHKYQLTFGVPSDQPDQLIEQIKKILNMTDRRSIWKEKRDVMLSDKIDVTQFLVNLIEDSLLQK